MKKNLFIKYQLTVIFLVIIFSSGISKIIGLNDFDRKDENRRFRDSLTVNISKLDDFPSDFELYTNDNFYFRSPLLDMFHRIKFYGFNVSPHPDQTIIGKDGWYFRSEEKELAILNGSLDFSLETLDSFSNEWEERTRYLKELNIPAFWIIAPLKHYVYDDKLPYNVQRSQTNRITTLTQHLETDFPNLIINPLETLRANKDTEKLYFKLDNHWNAHAGLLTTQLLIQRLRTEFPNKEIPDVPPLHWKGDTIQEGIHYRVLGIDALSEYRQTPVMEHPQSIVAEKYGFKSIEGFPYPWAFENRFVNDSIKNGLRVLIIRDSFGEAIEPFCREVFKESLFIFDAWQYKLNKPIIDRFKPDVIVFLSLETNVPNFLHDFGNE